MLTSMEYTQIGKEICIGTTNSDIKTDVNEITHNGENIIYPKERYDSYKDNGTTEEASYVTYYLNAKYSTLIGIIYRPYGTLKCDYVWREYPKIEIYGDGVLLYEAPKITQDTYESINLSVDVTGVRELKIITMARWTSQGDYVHPKACLADLAVQK